MPDLLSREDAQKLNDYWFAANYLTVGQIYLKDNPLLQRPLSKEDIKPRLLGHWGTTAGLNFIYTHLNRLIRAHDLNMMYIIGPGHGGPGIVAHTYLEGSYTEIYPNVEQNQDGIKRLFRQFSWPYGIPSHVAPETPGSIHEGGELGYSLLHAYGAAFDNPDLIVACIVGDGEAETGPQATSWHSNKFLNPVTDGAVLPILHLNGYKIANPTVLARIPEDELLDLFRGYGYAPRVLAGHEPGAMHRQMAAVLEEMLGDIREIQQRARKEQNTEGPKWPLLILRTPKGWTGPKEVDGKQVEGTWRAHQAPLSEVEAIRSTCRCSKRGCAATSRRSCGTSPGSCGGSGGAGAARLATHGHESSCEWRPAFETVGAAGFQELRGEGGEALGRGRKRDGERSGFNDAALIKRTPAWSGGRDLRCAVSTAAAHDFCFSRISMADSPADVPAQQSRQSACAGLQRRGDDNHAVRYDGPE